MEWIKWIRRAFLLGLVLLYIIFTLWGCLAPFILQHWIHEQFRFSDIIERGLTCVFSGLNFTTFSYAFFSFAQWIVWDSDITFSFNGQKIILTIIKEKLQWITILLFSPLIWGSIAFYLVEPYSLLVMCIIGPTITAVGWWALMFRRTTRPIQT